MQYEVRPLILNKNNRNEIHRKISESLKGKPHEMPRPRKALLAPRQSTEDRWKIGPWEKASHKKRRSRILLEQGDVCASCGIPPKWMDKDLPFELDHISGDRQDNSRENLRMLCPNCHRLTPTWGSKNASIEGVLRMQSGWKMRRVKS